MRRFTLKRNVDVNIFVFILIFVYKKILVLKEKLIIINWNNNEREINFLLR